MFDLVHLLKKCSKQLDDWELSGIDFHADEEKKTATWADSIALDNLETNQSVKLWKLAEVSVYTSPIEMQRFSICKVFVMKHYQY